MPCFVGCFALLSQLVHSRIAMHMHSQRRDCDCFEGRVGCRKGPNSQLAKSGRTPAHVSRIKQHSECVCTLPTFEKGGQLDKRSEASADLGAHLDIAVVLSARQLL